MSEPPSKGQTKIRLAGPDPLGIDAGAVPLGMDRLASARSEPVSDAARRQFGVSVCDRHLPTIESGELITCDTENSAVEDTDAVEW